MPCQDECAKFEKLYIILWNKISVFTISMKTIEVVAAIIVKDGKVFATQRGYGPWKGWWEFPGGKMEPGESPEEALTGQRQLAAG